MLPSPDPGSKSESTGEKDLSAIKAPVAEILDSPDEKAREESQFTESEKEKLTAPQFHQRLIRRQVEDLTKQRDSFRDELQAASLKHEEASDRARTLEVSWASKISVLESELRHARSYGGLSTIANILGGLLMAVVGVVELGGFWKGAAIASGVILMAIAAILALQEWLSRPNSKPQTVQK